MKLKTRDSLIKTEIVFLSLMLFFLPSLEAPKNIFLVLYLLAASYREFKSNTFKNISSSDFVFIFLTASIFLSSYFGGFSQGQEWKGLGHSLSYVFLGFFIKRSIFSKHQINFLFFLPIIAAIFPLTYYFFVNNLPIKYYYFFEYAFLWTRDPTPLQLNSVGHVNHTAIYLSILFGATFGGLVGFLVTDKKHNLYLILLLLLLSALIFFCVLYSNSRGSFGAIIILTVLLIYFLLPKKYRNISLLIFLAFMISVFSFQPSIVQKQKEISARNDFLSQRDKVWNRSLEASQWFPIFGIGIDNWPMITSEKIHKALEEKGEIYDSNRYYFKVNHSHSLYLSFLTERGVVGILSLFALFYLWVRTLFKAFKAGLNTSQEIYLWSGSFSAFFITSAVGLVNTTMHHEHGILAFFYLSLFLSFFEKYRRKT